MTKEQRDDSLTVRVVIRSAMVGSVLGGCAGAAGILRARPEGLTYLWDEVRVWTIPFGFIAGALAGALYEGLAKAKKRKPRVAFCIMVSDMPGCFATVVCR